MWDKSQLPVQTPRHPDRPQGKMNHVDAVHKFPRLTLS